jgi:hypothetical protein
MQETPAMEKGRPGEEAMEWRWWKALEGKA